MRQTNKDLNHLDLRYGIKFDFFKVVAVDVPEKYVHVTYNALKYLDILQENTCDVPGDMKTFCFLNLLCAFHDINNVPHSSRIRSVE